MAEEEIKKKAKELCQEYLPDNMKNIWARENIVAKCVESAIMEITQYKDTELRNQEQSLLWTFYYILDILDIEGVMRDCAIKIFKRHLINKDL